MEQTVLNIRSEESATHITRINSVVRYFNVLRVQGCNMQVFVNIEITRYNLDGQSALSYTSYKTHPNMSSFNFDPKDRRAIITGGSQGLGLEFARRLISQGSKVCICDIDTKAGEAAVQELRKQYGVGKEW